MKNDRLHIRLSEREYDLLSVTAKKYDMTLSHLILSVMVPFCLRTNRENIENLFDYKIKYEEILKILNS